MRIPCDFVVSLWRGEICAKKLRILKETKSEREFTMKKNSLLFLVGSCAYPTLEMLWRGYTHSSMALAGGVCMVLINKICCERMQKKSLTL